MKKTIHIVHAMILALILSGGSAFAATDVLQPATPSLTAAPDTSATVTVTTTPDSAAPATNTEALPSGQAEGAITLPPAKPGDGLSLSTEKAPSSIDPKDIPQVLLDEMKEIEKSCGQNYLFSTFHDCRCVSVKYLDARLKSDPAASKDRIFQSVGGQCTDDAKIAGFIFNSCAEYSQHLRTDYINYCKCAANDVAKTYKSAPRMNLRYIESLKRNAYRRCGIGNKAERPPRKFE